MNYLKDTVENIKTKSIFTTIFAVIVPTLIFILIRTQNKSARRMGVGYSVADSICEMTGMLNLISLLFVILAVFYNVYLNDDLSVSAIIRHESRGMIWLGKVYRSCVSSFFIAIYMMLSTIIISLYYADSWINFSQKDSIFYREISALYGYEPALNINISFLQVVLYGFLSLFAIILLFTIFLMLMELFTNHMVIGWLIIIPMPLIEGYGGVPILAKFLSNYYLYWLDMDYMMFRYIVPVIWFLVILILGFIKMRKRDFINET